MAREPGDEKLIEQQEAVKDSNLCRKGLCEPAKKAGIYSQSERCLSLRTRGCQSAAPDPQDGCSL